MRSMALADGGRKGTPTLNREPQKPPSMMFETLRKRSKPWWVIDPRKSRWMAIWDMAGTLALLYTALVTPFEVAFLEAPDTWTMARSDVLFLINRLVDAIFIIDMFVNFVLMYQEADAIRGVRWIDEPREIAAHYAKTWFFLDFFSTLPSLCDILPLTSDNGPTARGGGTGPTAASQFKKLRVIRCARLVRLVRLLRAGRLLKRWETRIAINYALLSLSKTVIIYLLVAHWSACALVLPTTFYDTPEDTWLGSCGFCSVVDGCVATHVLYIATLSHTLQVITGAVGSSLELRVFNTQEQLVYTVISVVGSLLWGYVIGTWVSVIANTDPGSRWFRQTMDGLNSFMSQYQLPREMRIRLREYFMQAQHMHQGQRRRELLNLMSPMLHGEVALAISGSWLRKVHFLQGAETEMLILAATNMRPAVYAPGEPAPSGYLYVIHKGVALYGGRVLSSGKAWGHDCILRDSGLRHASGRALSYVEVYKLSRREIIELARPFPIGGARLRWAAVRLAFIRFVLKSSSVHWSERGHSPTETKAATTGLTFDSAFDKASFKPRKAQPIATDPPIASGAVVLNLSAEEEAITLNDMQQGLTLVNDKVDGLATTLEKMHAQQLDLLRRLIGVPQEGSAQIRQEPQESSAQIRQEPQESSAASECTWCETDKSGSTPTRGRRHRGPSRGHTCAGAGKLRSPSLPKHAALVPPAPQQCSPPHPSTVCAAVGQGESGAAASPAASPTATPAAAPSAATHAATHAVTHAITSAATHTATHAAENACFGESGEPPQALQRAAGEGLSEAPSE